MKNYSSAHTVKNIINEPEIFYKLQNKYDRITSVLGGSLVISQPIHNELDLIQVTRKGLPKSVLITLSSILSISMEKMSNLLHISHRTIQRKSNTELLSIYSTEQVLEIADVVSRGIDVLGTIDAFTKWLHSELRALNYKPPLDYLDTSFGTHLIKDLLGRLEYGVHS